MKSPRPKVPHRLTRRLGALLLASTSLLPALPARAEEAAPSQAPPDTRLQLISPSGPGGRNITAFDRHAGSGFGGYYSMEFRQPFSGEGSRLDLHHLILQTAAHLHKDVFFNTEIEFEHGGLINTLSNDGQMEIEQAWVDYAPSEALGVRAGVVLIPFGVVNVLHDADIRETTTRPLMAQAILPTTWFEPGFGLHGLAFPNDDWQITYEGYVTQGLTDALSPQLGMRTARPSLSRDNNGNKAVTGRVGLSPWIGCEVGLSGYYGAYDPAGVQHLSVLGSDLTYTAGPFELLGEYARVGTAGGTSLGAGVPLAIPTGMDGYYLEGRWRFFPEALHQTLLGHAGGFTNPTFTALARYGRADTNHAAWDASDRTEALVGLNYRPFQTLAVKLEYQRVDEPATGRIDDGVWTSVAVGF